ncbi:MAG TPA: phosphatidate cytidylyltransferase [Bryobacteraceae bacterium]|jgi:phosphatidate cytidylyltransferase|nr:phosphatidate cytidylyltransferase [Bryobacteraceae bacterium]
MKRILTGVALIAVGSYLLLFGPQWLFMTAAAFMGSICYWEYSGLVAGHGILRPGFFGFLAGLIILFWPQYTLIGFSLISIVALVTALRHEDVRAALPQVSTALFGAFYTFAPWRFASDLRLQSVHLLFFATALNWAGDTAAYYVGRTFGRHKLAPVISPKKTWEGAAGSVAGSLLFGLLYMGHFTPLVPLWQIAVLAIFGNIAGQLGDLAESAMKRGAGVKDSGNLLPGHGGMLDRVDSSLFAIPTVFCLHQLLHYLLP